MIPTARPTAPVTGPAIRPRSAAVAAGLAAAPTIVRTCRDSSLFRGWGVKI